MRNIILSILVTMGMVVVMYSAVTVNATTQKQTICHATGSASNPWVRIVVSLNGTGGHFENNGTPKSGHEDDVLLQGEQDCPNIETYGTPYSTPYATPAYATPEYPIPEYATPSNEETSSYATPSGGVGGSSGGNTPCTPERTTFCRPVETYPTPYPTPVVVEHEGKG